MNPPKAVIDYCKTNNITCTISFISSANKAGEIRARASSIGLFAKPLDKFKIKNLPTNMPSAYFTLNRFNFDAAHVDLIPRAVAYSTGLMDYFFRGKIDVVKAPKDPGAYVLKNLGNEDMDGSFDFYYEDKNTFRYPSNSLYFRIAANGQSSPFKLEEPYDPVPKTLGKYIVVFRGNMGEEKSTAVAAKEVCTPSNDAINTYKWFYATEKHDGEKAPLSPLTSILVTTGCWENYGPEGPAECRAAWTEEV